MPNLTYKEVWDVLSKKDCTPHHEIIPLKKPTKDGKTELTYISWTGAWKMLMESYPQATYEFPEEKVLPNGSVTVFCIVRIENLSREMWLPVYDNRYQSIANPTSAQISNTRMRCLVKCIAMYGLGLYIYDGEDLPEKPNKPKESVKADPHVQEVANAKGKEKTKILQKKLKSGEINEKTDTIGLGNAL